MLGQLIRKIDKVRTVGPKAAVRVVLQRHRLKRTIALWRKNNNWLLLIPVSHRLLLQDRFLDLYTQVTAQSFACMLSLYVTDSHEQTITRADRYADHMIEVFGSTHTQCERMPWHTDIGVSSGNLFDPTPFFADISMQVHTGPECGKDIKAAWQLGRFQYLPILGRAYQYTGDRKYKDSLIFFIQDWIVSNHFLHGIHWVNGMEVAIRALNWILAFEYIKTEKDLSLEFKQYFVHSLYQHMLYLEHTWEYYDSRTNNHYITNLVGYLYLTHFFSTLPGCAAKFSWCLSELLSEFDKQIFAEGTSYEGSTQYHRLMTELFYLAYVLLQQQHMIVAMEVTEKLQRMISFLVWCSPRGGTLIKIGDDDSGVIILHGISYEKIAAVLHVPKDDTVQLQTFEQFGLSIIKTHLWHVTLRHHSYRLHQPSGHFHNDAGSITLSYNGVPIFVDPGSYVYTPSAFWRNQFRSTFSHNTFFIHQEEFTPLDEDLFALNLPVGQAQVTTFRDAATLGMSTQHGLYKRHGIFFERSVTLNQETDELIIADMCKSKIKQQHHMLGWNFTLAPECELHKDAAGCWIVTYQEKPILSVSSAHLKFMIERGFVAPSYGIKIPTNCLRAYASIKIDTPFVITMKALAA